MSDTMSGLPDCMTALLRPTDRRYGVHLHKGREEVGLDQRINSGNYASNNNKSKNHDHNNNKHNRSNDKKGNHRHMLNVMNEPETILEK